MLGSLLLGLWSQAGFPRVWIMVSQDNSKDPTTSAQIVQQNGNSESMATRGRQRPRWSPPCRCFSWLRLPTPGPPRSSPSNWPDLGRLRASSSFLPPFPPQQAKVRKKLSTCRIVGALCGRGTHGSLPVKCGALPGPASE